MHTSRLTTLLLIILSVHSRSHASQTQQDEGYYHVRFKRNKKPREQITYVYIQASTPFSKVYTYLQNNGYETDVNIREYKEDIQSEEVHSYTFGLPSQSFFPNNIGFKELLEKHLSFDKQTTTTDKKSNKTIIDYAGIVKKNSINASSNNATSTVQFTLHEPKKVPKETNKLIQLGGKSIVFTKKPANNDIDIIEINSKDDIQKLNNIVSPAQKTPTQAPIKIVKKKSLNNNIPIPNKGSNNFSSRSSIYPPSVSNANPNQQNEKYYQVNIDDPNNEGRLFIQQSIPVSMIRACMEQYNLPYKMVHWKSGTKKYCFDFPSSRSVHDTLSFQEFLNNHVSFPTVPSETTQGGFGISPTNIFHGTVSESNLQNNTTSFNQMTREIVIRKITSSIDYYGNIPNIVLTKDTSKGEVYFIKVSSKDDIPKLNNIVSPAQTKILNNNNLNDSDAYIINTTNTNDRLKPVVINNTSQNSNLNNNQNDKQTKVSFIPKNSKQKPLDNNLNIVENDSDTPLSPSYTNLNNKNIPPPLNKNTSLSQTNGISLNSPKNNTQNIVNNNNQSTLNNNNNSNQAGIYILVVFGLTVCAGIVYAMIPSAPTSNSHKPNQDTPQQTS